MRLTNSMMIKNLMINLNKTSVNVNKYNSQVQTGKLFQLPSDNPLAAAKSIRYKSQIAQLEQSEKNIEDANELLKVTETSIDSYNDILSRISELSVEASNGTKSDSDREAIKVEVQQLKEEIIRISNTQYNGRYIFSGYKTDQPLMTEDGKYNIDVVLRDETVTDPVTGDVTEKKKETINYNIGFGNSVQVNTLGPSIFEGEYEENEDGDKIGQPGVIKTLDELMLALDSGDASEIRAAGKKIDNHLQVGLDALADVGGRMNRIALTKTRIESSLSNLEESQSLNEDVDYADAITNLASAKSIYQAALMTGSTAIQKSLLDYL